MSRFLLALLLLAGCGRHAATEAGGVSAEDAEMLNNAAAMLDTGADNQILSNSPAGADAD